MKNEKLNTTTSYNLLKENKRKGIEVIYNRYGKKLYAFAIKNWKVDEDQSWDLVYKTLYKIADVHEQYTFEDEQKFSSFIFKIFVNYLRNHYRDINRLKEQAEITTFNDSLLEGDNDQLGLKTERDVNRKIAQVAMQDEAIETDTPQMQALKSELDKLDEWQKMLLLLRSQNLPYSEIEKYVDRPAKQLKVYYQRLKDKLEKRIAQSHPSPQIENAYE